MTNLTATPPVKTENDKFSSEERCGYVYETFCKVSKKLYIGKHESKVFSNRYHGSGKHFKYAWKKYGPKQFITRAIWWAKNSEELNQAEKDFISAYRHQFGWRSLYNIGEGGDGWPKGKKMDAESGKKMSSSRTGMRYSDAVKKKRSAAVKRSWKTRSRVMSQIQRNKISKSLFSMNRVKRLENLKGE